MSDDARELDDVQLIDASAIPLERLVALQDDALTAALKRVLRELDAPQEIMSAFDSYVIHGEPTPPK